MRRHPQLIASAAAVLIALGLTSCGASGQSGFTTGSPPTKPSDFSTMRPTLEMANETEALLLSQRPGYFASPKCVPADSLDGVGEFNFDCTARDLEQGGWVKLGVVVFGTDSGEPKLGPVIAYACDPVNSRGEDLPSTC